LKYLILITIAILSTVSICAQNIDSLFNEIEQIDGVETQIEQLIKHAEQFAGNDNTLSAQCIRKAENLAKPLNDSCAFCIIIFGKGILSQAKSEYKNAFTHYHDAYRCAKTCHNAYVLIHSTNNLGVLNRIADNSDKALEWYELSLRFSKEYHDTLRILYTLNNIGNIHNAAGNPKTAIHYYQECTDMLRLVPEHHDFYTTVYPNFAYAYYAQGNRTKAIKLYEKSFSLLDTLDHPYHHAVILKTLAELYLEENDAHTALLYLNKAKYYYQQIENKQSEASYYFLRYQTQLELGNHKAALIDLETYQMLQDSIDIESMHVLLSDIQEKYDNEKLKQINSIQNETIRKRNQMLLYIGFGGIFLLILLGLSMQINRYRKKTNLALKQKQNTINEGLSYGRFVKEKLMFSSPKLLDNNGFKHFIIDKPKDKVGGDFYLIRAHQNGIYIILGDATGHGIPGGFISLTALNLFHRELQHHEDIQPSELLSNVLKEWENMSNSKDAYDESFTAAVFFISQKQIEMAHYRQKSVHITKDKLTVIGKKSSLTSEIKTHALEMQAGDWIIMTSDGYYDQLGEISQKTYRFKNFTSLIQSNLKNNEVNMANVLTKEHLRHKGKLEQTDDILVIGIGF